MKKVFRHIIATAAAAAAVVYIAAALGVSGAARKNLKCTGLKVTVTDSAQRGFVTAGDVRKYLDREFSGYTGMRVSDLDLTRAESIIDAKSAVLKSEAYITPEGLLNVSVTQRDPVVRFQKGRNGFYADADGCIFPLQSNYTARVPIVDGHIPVSEGAGFKGRPDNAAEEEWIMKVIGLVEYMGKDKVWAEDITQITVQPNGDLVMIPRKGKERFIFGSPDRYEEKFRLMELYYTGIVPEKGEDFYSTVNVKYDNQIICRK